MASIFGRRQKQVSNKNETQVSNGRQIGVETLLAAEILEQNDIKGANSDSADYHKNGRHSSSTFKPQIPPPSISSINSSLPAHAKDMNGHFTQDKR